MRTLALVSLLWAASPGLIKHELAGLPSTAVAAIRLGLTALAFLPWLRLRPEHGLTRAAACKLAAVGAVQFGVMYLFYVRAFAHLQAHEVFIFTVLTPFYVVMLDALFERRATPRHVIAAWLSILGALVIVPRAEGSASAWLGFALVQGANLCFAAGQIGYRRIRPSITAPEPPVFAWLALGGALATLAAAGPLTPWAEVAALVTQRQLVVLAFLGFVASGLGFFLWNVGARSVDAGTLAVFNNVKLPLGVLVSLALFSEPAEPVPLTASLLLIGAGLWMSSSARRAIS